MLASFPTPEGDGAKCRCGHDAQLIVLFDVPPKGEAEMGVCFACLRSTLTRLHALGVNYNGQDLVVEHTDMACPKCCHPLNSVVLCYACELSASDMALRCSGCGHVVASWARVEHREGE